MPETDRKPRLSRASKRRFRGALLGGREWLASGFAVGSLGLLAGFITLPIVAMVFWTASEDSWAAMASPVALQALFVSLKTTAVTLVFLVIFGTPAAYVLARGRFPGVKILNTLVELPIVLPPSAAGIALLLAFGRLGLIGEPLDLAFGITLSFTTVAVIMSQVFVAVPFYVRQAATGFSEVDRTIEEAAMVDGAGRTGTFFRITVPLAFPALVAGAITAWARALGEFGATIIFAGNFAGVTQTIPLAIYSEFQSNLDAAVALSLMVLVFAFAVILAVRYLTRQAVEYRD